MWPLEKWLPKERGWLEQQKKAAEAYHAEKAATAAPETAPTSEGESPKSESPNSGGLFGLSANQWIGIGGICVSLLGIYYKWEELKAMAKPVFDKFKMPEPTPEPAPEPAPVEPARATQRKGLRKMI